MSGSSYLDHYGAGAFKPYVRGLRSISTLHLLELAQPAGDLSDPPVAELVLIQSLTPLTGSFDHGGGRFRCDARPGDLFFVPARFATTVLIDRPHFLRALFWDADTAAVRDTETSDLSERLASLTRGPFRNPFLDALIPRLWGCAEEGRAASRLGSDFLSQLLVEELLAAAKASTKASMGGLAPWQVRRCLDYLHVNLAEDVGVAALARVAQLSSFHFARAFKRSVGVPPHRY